MEGESALDDRRTLLHNKSRSVLHCELLSTNEVAATAAATRTGCDIMAALLCGKWMNNEQDSERQDAATTCWFWRGSYLRDRWTNHSHSQQLVTSSSPISSVFLS